MSQFTHRLPPPRSTSGSSSYPFTQDVRYLKPHVLEVVKEDQERQVWDTMNVTRK